MITRLEKVLIHRPRGFWRVDIIDELGVTFAHSYRSDYKTAVDYGNGVARLYQIDVEIRTEDNF